MQQGGEVKTVMKHTEGGDLDEIALKVQISGLPKECEHDYYFSLPFKVEIRRDPNSSHGDESWRGSALQDQVAAEIREKIKSVATENLEKRVVVHGVAYQPEEEVPAGDGETPAKKARRTSEGEVPDGVDGGVPDGVPEAKSDLYMAAISTSQQPAGPPACVKSASKLVPKQPTQPPPVALLVKAGPRKEPLTLHGSLAKALGRQSARVALAKALGSVRDRAELADPRSQGKADNPEGRNPKAVVIPQEKMPRPRTPKVVAPKERSPALDAK